MAERVCNCTGPMTQTVHASNAEGHQVGCPRWGITYGERPSLFGTKPSSDGDALLASVARKLIAAGLIHDVGGPIDGPYFVETRAGRTEIELEEGDATINAHPTVRGVHRG